MPWFWWRSTRGALAPSARLWCHLLPAVLALQIGLGIMTLLFSVPVALGAAHQAGAMLLLTTALLVNHQLLVTAGDERT